MTQTNALTQRLDAGPVICAEGFLFELEKRGYLSAGEFVPEVALEFPDALRSLHVDFQRAGSDIVEAFTYNGHREKMRVIGKEDLLEPLNRSALQIARSVADEVPGNFMAGNISNSNIWDPAETAKQDEVRAMFAEMVGWAVEEGADLIIGETFYFAGEAIAAAEIAKLRACPSSSPSRRWHSRRWPTGSASSRPPSGSNSSASTSSASTASEGPRR